MSENSERPGKPDVEERIGNLREGITAADATGMVASEELLALPHEDMHAALPDDHAAHTTVDELHAEIRKPAPDPSAIEAHVKRLRLLPELEAIVVTWWDDPRVQRFFADLGQIGV
jgi:microcompartment protein CcmL/EutN